MAREHPSRGPFPLVAVGAETGCDDEGMQSVNAEWIVDGLQIPYIASSQPSELAKCCATRRTLCAVLQNFARAGSEDDLGRQAKRFRKDPDEGVRLLVGSEC
jgi:hypothetical protein